MKISKDLNSLTTTQRGLASVIGISQQRVSALAKDGIVVTDETGAVKVFPSLRNYYAHRYDDNVADDVDFGQERARHEKAKREIAEIKLEKLQHSIYSARTVETVMITMLSNLRTRLLGMPAKLAPQLEGLSKGEINKLITAEMEAALNELSEYTPDVFIEAEREEADDEDGD